MGPRAAPRGGSPQTRRFPAIPRGVGGVLGGGGQEGSWCPGSPHTRPGGGGAERGAPAGLARAPAPGGGGVGWGSWGHPAPLGAPPPPRVPLGRCCGLSGFGAFRGFPPAARADPPAPPAQCSQCLPRPRPRRPRVTARHQVTAGPGRVAGPRFPFRGHKAPDGAREGAEGTRDARVSGCRATRATRGGSGTPGTHPATPPG